MDTESVNLFVTLFNIISLFILEISDEKLFQLKIWENKSCKILTFSESASESLPHVSCCRNLTKTRPWRAPCQGWPPARAWCSDTRSRPPGWRGPGSLSTTPHWGPPSPSHSTSLRSDTVHSRTLQGSGSYILYMMPWPKREMMNLTSL